MGSSARFGLELAPGGLAFVQELVNTAPADPALPVPDLLGALCDARAWLEQALALWAGQEPIPAVELSERDLPRLRALREAVRRGEDVDGHRVEIEIAAGRARYRPVGAGWRLVASIVATEILLAQHAGTWARVKSCQNPVCGLAFYDRSRNGSRVWHDTSTCGNVMNLRASRARRRG